MTVRVQILILLWAAGGVAVLYFATASGIGLSPDSAAYIGAARGLLAGLGLGTPAPNGGFRPLLLYAPLFPILVAAIGRFGIDPSDGARYLNCALFAGSICLAGLMTGRDTRSAASALVASMLLLVSLPLLKVHSMAWSEPTFVFLSILALLCFSRYAEHGGLAWLIGAALAVGLGILARHAGAALIAAGVAVILMQRQPCPRNPMRECAIFAVVSGLVCSVSFVRNRIVGGTAFDRPVTVHMVDTAHLARGVRTLGRWLWLDARPGIQAVVVLAVLACALLARPLAATRPPDVHPGKFGLHDGRSRQVERIALIFIIAYGVFLLAAMSFIDDVLDIPFDDRILSPMLAWAIIGGVCAAHRLAARLPRRGMMRALVVAAGVWFAAAQVSQDMPWLLDVHRHGQGYASAAWRESETMTHLRDLPWTTRIFSNGDDAIYVLTGRLADRLPERRPAVSTQASEGYAADLARMHTQLVDSHGVIVYFSTIDWRPNLVSITELQDRFGLRLLHSATDGAVYAVAE